MPSCSFPSNRQRFVLSRKPSSVSIVSFDDGPVGPRGYQHPERPGRIVFASRCVRGLLMIERRFVIRAHAQNLRSVRRFSGPSPDGWFRRNFPVDPAYKGEQQVRSFAPFLRRRALARRTRGRRVFARLSRECRALRQCRCVRRGRRLQTAGAGKKTPPAGAMPGIAACDKARTIRRRPAAEQRSA